MTVTDQIKILDRKIKQNESQYDLDREAAKISALSSNNLGKYELLTGADLGLKPSTIEQPKFEYSPLRKIFNKGLSEDDKKEGLLKSLKNIEDKNEKPLEVKDKANENMKEVSDFIDQPLSLEAKELIKEIKDIQKNVDYRKLKIRGGNNIDYDFGDCKTFKELFRDFYYKQTTIDDIERKQDEITGVMGALKAYTPRDNKYVEAKNKLVNNVENFYKGREKIIKPFRNKVFPLYRNETYEYQMKAQRETQDEEENRKEKEEKRKKKKKIFPMVFDDETKQDEQKEQKPIKVDYKTLIKQIADEEKYINNEIFKNILKFKGLVICLCF